MTARPPRGARLARAVLLLVVAAWATAADSWVAGIAMGLAVTLSVWVPKARVTLLGQLALALVAVAAGWFLTLYVGPLSHEIRTFEELNAIGWFAGMAGLLVVVSRQFVESPWLGPRGDAVACFIAVLGAGDAMADPWYPAYAALYLPLQLAALARTDPSRTPWRGLPRVHRRVAVAAVAKSLAVAAALIMALPLGYDWSIDYFTDLYLQHRAGFSTELMLGSMEDMMLSDEPMMRITGALPGPLRGIVYARYHRGSWLVSQALRQENVRLSKAGPSGPTASTIRVVGGEQDRLFLPLDAARVEAGDLDLFADGTGIPTCEKGRADRVSFVSAPRDALRLAPPTGEDLDVPGEIRPALARIASGWVNGTRGDGPRLQAIERRLGEGYAYSLSFSRSLDLDPVLDFLTQKKQGHCEYFAAAMALLARSVGIPARVVGGFAVREYNPIGKYYVVRKRHAHAWVEAWVEGRGWTTWDPTPARALAGQTGSETRGAGALADLAAYWWGEGIFWLSRRTSAEVAAAVGFLLAFWFGLRALRSFREKARARGAWKLGFSDPLPALTALLDFLGQKGETARFGEPLERFAERLGRSRTLGSGGAEAGRLIRRYAAFRYGFHGTEEEIAREIESWISRQ